MRLSLLTETGGPRFTRRSLFKMLGLGAAAAAIPSPVHHALSALGSAVAATPKLVKHLIYPSEWDPDGFHRIFGWNDGVVLITGEKSGRLYDKDGNLLGEAWRGGFDTDDPKVVQYFRQIYPHFNDNGEYVDPDEQGGLWDLADEMADPEMELFDRLYGSSPKMEQIRYEREYKKDKEQDPSRYGQPGPTDFELHDPYEDLESRLDAILDT